MCRAKWETSSITEDVCHSHSFLYCKSTLQSFKSSRASFWASHRVVCPFFSFLLSLLSSFNHSHILVVLISLRDHHTLEETCKDTLTGLKWNEKNVRERERKEQISSSFNFISFLHLFSISSVYRYPCSYFLKADITSNKSDRYFFFTSFDEMRE